MALEFMASKSTLILVLVSSILLHFYLKTMSPSIAGGDSGEIVAEGCQLGTAHPPGYPLITVLIHLITRYIPQYIPKVIGGTDIAGSPAYMVNVFCAACTIGACQFMGMLVHEASSTPHTYIAGSMFTMCMFAFSPLIWQYGVTAEVFPLNTFFAALILYQVVLFSRCRRMEVLAMGAFTCGLALTNQHTIILYEVPLICWMLFLSRKCIQNEPALFWKLSAAFISGISAYVYLPIAAVARPVAGSWGNVATLQGFIHHLLRRDYGTFQLFSGAAGKQTENMIERTSAYVTDAVHVQGLYIVPLLAVLGMMYWVTDSILNSNGASSVLFSFWGGKRSGVKRYVPGPSVAAASTINNNNGKMSKNQKKHNKTQLQQQQGASVDSVKAKADLAAATTTTTTTALAAAPEAGWLHLSSCDVYTDKISPEECALTPCVLAVTQFFYFFVFHSLSNLPLSDRLLYGVHQRFWMQPNVMLFAVAGIGVNTIIHLTSSTLRKALFPPPAPNTTSTTTSSSTSTSGNRMVDYLVRLIGFLLALYAVYLQYSKWLGPSDNHEHQYFKNYATAILDPLPQNAILLINYDQQWTSVRYVQQCEGFRSDVTVINLSMMTYSWFQHKRTLYENVTFPGSYHTYPGSTHIAKDGAFTLQQFVSANINQRPVFLGGKVNYPDARLDEQFDMVPTGIVAQFVPIKSVPDGTAFLKSIQTSWKSVMQRLPSLPNEAQFPQETWEWTIGRDFKDRVTDTAAYMLLTAQGVADTDPAPLINAIYWLESAYLLEMSSHNATNATPSTSLLKNIGLGHVHLIQNKILAALPTEQGSRGLPRPKSDIFGTLSHMHWPNKEAEWKSWSSNRFVFAWGEFLKREAAKKDPQYGTIKNMYETATKHIHK